MDDSGAEITGLRETKAMFLTVCPNTALDKILFIDEWIAGTPMRTDRIVNCVGGKGLNSAVVLKHLGIDTTSIGFFAGKIGQELIDILDDYGIIAEAIWVDGTTRVAHVIADKKRNQHSHVIAGNMIVNAQQKEEFIKRFEVLVGRAKYVILAGSVPKSMHPGLYTELIPIARQNGVPTIVDAQHEIMIEAIKVKPDIVKMNWDEFGWTFRMRSTTINELVVEAEAFHADKGLKNLVVTLAKDGILAVSENGTYLAKAPRQEPVNAAGAGDAVSSALAVKLTAGESWEEALRFASAVSAAAVLTERTGDVEMRDVTRILPHVTVEKIH